MRGGGICAFFWARRIEVRVAELRPAVETANRTGSPDLRVIGKKTKPRALPAHVHGGIEIVDLHGRRGDKVVLQRPVVELHGYDRVARIVSGRQVLAYERQQVVEA